MMIEICWRMVAEYLTLARSFGFHLLSNLEVIHGSTRSAVGFRRHVPYAASGRRRVDPGRYSNQPRLRLPLGEDAQLSCARHPGPPVLPANRPVCLDRQPERGLWIAKLIARMPDPLACPGLCRGCTIRGLEIFRGVIGQRPEKAQHCHSTSPAGHENVCRCCDNCHTGKNPSCGSRTNLAADGEQVFDLRRNHGLIRRRDEVGLPKKDGSPQHWLNDQNMIALRKTDRNNFWLHNVYQSNFHLLKTN